MRPVLSAQAMREADQFTIDRIGIPGFTLMETAGRASVDVMMDILDAAAFGHVVCLCGKGNNGGDGFVAARVLQARGVRVTVVMLHEVEALTPDSRRHHDILAKMRGERLRVLPYDGIETLQLLDNPTCWIDAMLGIGIEGELRMPYRQVVRWLNHQAEPVVALDVPTGLHADRGEPLGDALNATLSVAMGALKPGLLLHEAAGDVVTVEIGIPAFVMAERAVSPGSAWMAEDQDIASSLPGRDRTSHKHRAGLVLGVAGSRGLTGAAAMASRAAARVGAGAVMCATPASAEPALASKLVDVTSIALPEHDDGIEEHGALDVLAGRLDKAHALLVGCGLGRSDATDQFIRTLLMQSGLPTVVDADGLRALAGRTDFIKAYAKGQWILTPHLGEFKALAGEQVDLQYRVETVRYYANAWNCVLVLKGLPSIVGSPDGQVFINATGNPALATAGTGDVLAGMCAGLLAQSMPPFQAAVAALHIGGAVADTYISSQSMQSMVATDMIELLPHVLHNRFS